MTYLPISQLSEYEGNAKIHDRDNVDAIKASIERFGNCDPIGVWTDPHGNHVIVEGHGRKMALAELGHESAPCIFLNHLTDEERKAYALAHNQTTLMTGFDMDTLSLEMNGLDGFEMSDFGFDDFTVQEKEYADVEEFEPLDEDDVETRSKPGDVWILGDHRLMCGSSTDEGDVAALMQDDRADLVCSDPPYNVAYTGGTEDELTIQNDDMGDDEFEAFLTDAFRPAFDRLEPGAAFYIWHSSSSQMQFENAIKAAGMKVRQQLVWVKNAIVLGRSDYHYRHEPCFYGWREGAPHRWYADRRQSTVYEDVKPEDVSKMSKAALVEHCKALMANARHETVMRFDKPTSNAEHPTMKPVKLMAYQIENSTERGHIVMDMFGGSGSTLIACEQLGRACRTMEIDPRYCDVIIDRWERLTGRKAQLAGSN